MKRLMIIIMMIVGMSTLIEAKSKYFNFNNSIDYFYSSLHPYGEWIEIDVDLIAWRPYNVNWDWKPYTLGRWTWTNHGWYWDSFEPFGWATYHYGRWFYDDYYGWLWIPDNTWGPSWVEWRYDDDYIGWAPLPPYAEFRINLGIYFSISWHSNYTYWNFVPFHRFHDHRIHRYLLSSKHCSKIFHRTKYRNNYYQENDRIINGGIDRNIIERRTGYRISQRDLNEVNDYSRFERTRNSRDGEIYSYRPNERTMNNSRNENQFEIKRGEKRASLEIDKIVVSGRTRSSSIEREDIFSRDKNDNRINDRIKTDRNNPDFENRRQIDRNDAKQIERKKESNRTSIFHNRNNNQSNRRDAAPRSVEKKQSNTSKNERGSVQRERR